MADGYLETYLNDHLAGSMGAVDLLKRLEAAGTNMTQDFVELRMDVEADQQELRGLMARVVRFHSCSNQTVPSPSSPTASTPSHAVTRCSVSRARKPSSRRVAHGR